MKEIATYAHTPVPPSYEQKRLLCARRLENGYRDLDEEAIKRVQTIQMYLGLGLTTEQIEEILQCASL